jgi:hypothetical protein
MTSVDALLEQWAAAQRLSAADAAAIHSAVLRPDDSEELDADWLRGLLRPVTALLDGPHGLYETLSVRI